MNTSLIVPASVAFASSLFLLSGCGDEPPGGTGDSTAASSASGTATSTGTGGTSSSTGGGGAGGEGGDGVGGGAAGSGGEGGAGAAGGGGSGGGSSCDAIHAQLESWISSHQACGDAAPCARIDMPLDSGLCDVVAAPGGDEGELQALIDAWNAAGCDVGGTCGFKPGTAVCEAGVCALDVDDDCQNCPQSFDPWCTVDNLNAFNECYAVSCLKSQVAYPGYCPDSAECTAVGGTCEETLPPTAPCPDGTKWDHGNDVVKNCPNGNLINTCCTPWDQPCSFVAHSATLQLNPFTCAPPIGGGAPWTCLHFPQQSTCSLDGSIEQPFGPPYNADIHAIAAFGSQVKVTGQNFATGRTFTCTGTVAFDFSTVETWACEACDGPSCTTCNIDVSGYCQL